jgi:hypothetical protein
VRRALRRSMNQRIERHHWIQHLERTLNDTLVWSTARRIRLVALPSSMILSGIEMSA